MAYPAERQPMTVTEYRALEEASDVRHELINGEAYAMSGGTSEHATIATNLAIATGTRIRGTGCRAVAHVQRVNVPLTGAYLYPDMMVICGDYQHAADDPNAVTNPRVIFEVLSPSTQDYDQGTKFSHYRRLPSLREYVLVYQDEQRVVHYQRVDDAWVMREITEGSVRLPSLEIELPFDESYDIEGVRR